MQPWKRLRKIEVCFYVCVYEEKEDELMEYRYLRYSITDKMKMSRCVKKMR